jgi:ubiquinone/menaquinone biosynthesis C-methylase UbiE
MGFYRDHVYPQLVARLGDPPPIQRRRRELLSTARGVVLEIGVGPGVNFVHYDPGKVTKLYALEPNPGMVRLAEDHRRRTELDVEFLDLPGESIPLGGASIDTVVSTFTLCTIPGVLDAIQGIVRVLKPGGRLIFFEISLSPLPPVRRWQRWWEPVHLRMFEGLYLTRDIPSLLEEGGLRLLDVETGYLAPFPKCWSHCCWGGAAPQRQE